MGTGTGIGMYCGDGVPPPQFWHDFFGCLSSVCLHFGVVESSERVSRRIGSRGSSELVRVWKRLSDDAGEPLSKRVVSSSVPVSDSLVLLLERLFSSCYSFIRSISNYLPNKGSS